MREEEYNRSIWKVYKMSFKYPVISKLIKLIQKWSDFWFRIYTYIYTYVKIVISHIYILELKLNKNKVILWS
jgi:hypothetical protein